MHREHEFHLIIPTRTHTCVVPVTYCANRSSVERCQLWIIWNWCGSGPVRAHRRNKCDSVIPDSGPNAGFSLSFSTFYSEIQILSAFVPRLSEFPIRKWVYVDRACRALLEPWENCRKWRKNKYGLAITSNFLSPIVTVQQGFSSSLPLPHTQSKWTNTNFVVEMLLQCVRLNRMWLPVKLHHLCYWMVWKKTEVNKWKLQHPWMLIKLKCWEWENMRAARIFSRVAATSSPS